MPCLSSSVDTTLLTKPSSRRISAIRSLMFDRGHSTSDLRARIPLRMRARRSAIGSVIDILALPSPARLDDARDIAAERELSETAAAHLELAQVGARAAAALAAGLDANLELLLLGERIDQLGHDYAAPAAPVVGAG